MTKPPIAAARLRQLKALSDLKAEHSKAVYARKMKPVREIARAMEALAQPRSDTVPETLEDAANLENFAVWRVRKRAELRNAYALALAQAQPSKEASARDEARAQVLGKLKEKGRP